MDGAELKWHYEKTKSWQENASIYWDIETMTKIADFEWPLSDVIGNNIVYSACLTGRNVIGCGSCSWPLKKSLFWRKNCQVSGIFLPVFG